MSEDTVNPFFGKPWENSFTFKTFKAADNKRNKLLESEDLQVKVKRRTDGVFVVKTRSLIATTLSKTKKSKSKKTNSTKGKG